MFPQMNWNQSYDFEGQDPMGFGQAMQTMQDLGELDQLENLLRNATNPGALAEADMDRVRDLMGDDAARSLERLAELAKMLEEAGLIQKKEGRLELTPKGMRKIGSNALRDLFSKLAKDKIGQHQMSQHGQGHERTYETKYYEYGDPFNLDLQRTIRNALRRTRRRHAGHPAPRRLRDRAHGAPHALVHGADARPVDEHADARQLPPGEEGRDGAALPDQSQFPRDYLGIVGFGEIARVLTAAQLPEVSWDFVYGTNMHHGFMLARQLLARRVGTKQIIMITDGEPTAHITPGRRTRSSTTRRCGRRSRPRCVRSCGARGTTSGSTPSCSMPTVRCERSSRR